MIDDEVDSDMAEQIMSAYQQIREAGVTLPADDPFDEAAYFWEMEDAKSFNPGYIDYPDRKVLVFLYQAMCALCAVNHTDVLKLLELAKADLQPRSRGNVSNALFGSES